MAETTLQLGFVPKERGNYVSGTNYYKDNIVQYNGSSYIADPVGWSEDDPTATYVTIAPTDASGNLNAGWKVFASGNNTFTTGEKVDNVGIDSEPTAGSQNLITSGGVGSAFVPIISKIGDITIQSDITAGQTYNLVQNVSLKSGDKIYVTTTKSGGLTVSAIQLLDDANNLLGNITNANNLEITLSRDTTQLSVYMYGGHISAGGNLLVNITTGITARLDHLPVMIQSVTNENDKIVSAKGIKNAIMRSMTYNIPLNDGHYADMNGAIQDSPYFGYVEIPVTSGARIRLFVAIEMSDAVTAVFYDKNGNFVSSGNYSSSAGQEYVVESISDNITLMRINYRVAMKNSLYVFIDLCGVIDSLRDSVAALGGNIFEDWEPANLSQLQFYSHSISSSGMVETITDTSMSFTRSGTKGNDTERVAILGLRPGIKYHLAMDMEAFVASQSFCRIVDANTNTTLLECVPNNGKVSADFTPLNTGRATQFYIYIRYAEDATISFDNIRITEYGEEEKPIFKPTNIGELNAPFANQYADSQGIFDGIDPTTFGGNDMMVFKKGLCIGDSLVAGAFNYDTAIDSNHAIVDSSRNYPQFLSRLLGGITIDVAATGGYTTVDWWDNYGNNDYSGHDFVIIHLGGNDVYRNVPTQDTIDALTNIINKFRGYTGMKIFVCTGFPFKTYAGIQYSIKDVIVSVVESFDDDNVILLDTLKYSHVFNDDAYTNVHATAYGYWKIAQELKNYISWYINTHKSQFRAVQFIGTEYEL